MMNKQEKEDPEIAENLEAMAKTANEMKSKKSSGWKTSKMYYLATQSLKRYGYVLDNEKWVRKSQAWVLPA